MELLRPRWLPVAGHEPAVAFLKNAQLFAESALCVPMAGNAYMNRLEAIRCAIAATEAAYALKATPELVDVLARLERLFDLEA